MSPECSLYVAEMFPICRQTALGDTDTHMVRWPLIIYNNDYIRISNTRLKFKILLRIKDRGRFWGAARVRGEWKKKGAREEREEIYRASAAQRAGSTKRSADKAKRSCLRLSGSRQKTERAAESSLFVAKRWWKGLSDLKEFQIYARGKGTEMGVERHEKWLKTAFKGPL